MQQISPSDLQQKIINKEDFQLIDVRELNEHAAFNIGGELMPLSELMDFVEKNFPNKTCNYLLQKRNKKPDCHSAVGRKI